MIKMVEDYAEENLFQRIGIDQPKLVSDVKLSEEVDTSRVIELLDPKYKLSNQVVSLIQTYLGYKSTCQVDTYSQNNVVGRLYSNSSSQYLPSEVRNTLFPDSFDIDITCCAQTIIKNILEKLEIPCPKLNYYITHRKKILSSLAEKYKLQEWEVKALFNAILNGQDKNGDLSVYVKIMKGEHDHTLSWPYKPKCEISAKSRNGKFWKKIIDFKKDLADSASTQQPKDEQGNTAFGCPSFIEKPFIHRYLEHDPPYGSTITVYFRLL